MDEEHVKDVCKPGSEQCCCYLGMSGKGWICLKEDEEFKQSIDGRLLRGEMKAIFDNCVGYNSVISNTSQP